MHGAHIRMQAAHFARAVITDCRTLIHMAAHGTGNELDATPVDGTDPGPLPIGDAPGRQGMKVYPDEVQPGDLVRDGGVLRAVTSITVPGYAPDSAHVHLLPREGLSAFIPVPRDVKIYVLRTSRY
jgi:hypothetical protein